MNISISNFKVGQKNRTIRELITTPQGNIEVYEPRIEDIQAIIDLQREQNFGAETGVVRFDGAVVIRSLYPMLTNINLGELTDEELEEVIENPSIHLLIAQQVIAQIVAESNKLYAERVKTELMNAESSLAQAEIMNQLPQFIIEKAKGDGKIAELVQKVEEASEKLEEVIEKDKVDEKSE